MDQKNSSLNPSSILDLKAELHKKYESFRTAKVDHNAGSFKRTPFKCKTDKEKPKKIVPNCEPKKDEKEDQELKKSRLALEAKAKLYDKIVSNNILIDDEANEAYLVDFQRKVLYATPVTATGNRKEDDKCTLDSQSSKSLQSSTAESSTKLDPDQPLHYQNVQYNEVRDHGTAYFAFSGREEERTAQMRDLRDARKETEEQRSLRQKLEKKRKTALQARLAKICERKNIDQSVLESFAEKAECETKSDLDVSGIPLPKGEAKIEETKIEEKEEAKVRPWDIGKEQLFIPQIKKRKTQKGYVEERREERQSEFAPPTFYK